jgi:prepilin-type N-terminal cleavage/methylation domain-containing protein
MNAMQEGVLGGGGCDTCRALRPLSGQEKEGILCRDDGVTLIELLVAVTIISILVFAGAIEFQGWYGSYRVESQVKEVFADLMNARSRAMQRNTLHFVQVTANNYQVYEDSNGNGALDAGTDNKWWTNPKPLNYPSLQTGVITFNVRGLVMTNPAPPAGTEAYMRFNRGTNRPDYDCILLGTTNVNPGTRIKMGKWDNATAVCAPL